jgi:hypothetical protein
MNNLIKRMIGAARLDSQTYERVEADPELQRQPCLSSCSRAWLLPSESGERSGGILGVTLGAIATWMVWVGLTYVIGTRIFRKVRLTRPSGRY